MAKPSLSQLCPTCQGQGKVPSQELADDLKRRREEAGITLTAMAAAIGISTTHLGDIEKGHRGLSVEIASKYETQLTELTK